MIIFLYGNAFNKRYKKQKDIIKALKKKRPESEVFFMNEENFELGRMEELLYGSGLFDEKHIIVLTSLFKEKDSQKYILNNLKKISESSHVFVLVEDDVLPGQLKKLSEYTYMVEGVSSQKKTEKDFNFFSFTDAIGKRDKVVAWSLLSEGLVYGKDVEGFYNLFFWMIKGMRAAQVSSSAKEAGMKPFPYNKAKNYSKNYTPQELEKLSLKLIEASQKERKGINPLRFSIEKLILEL